MKYAIRQRSDFRYINEVNEIIIDWAGSDQIIDFVQDNFKQEQRIIIDIIKMPNKQKEGMIAILNMLREIHSNFVLRFDFRETKQDYFQEIKENNIPFMFINFAGSYDILYTLASYDPTDIYIVQELVFDLPAVQSIRERGIKLRCFPDVAQSAPLTTSEVPTIQQFWVRPEDTEEYEKYIDVFEFFRADDRLSTVFEIYQNRQWTGDLGFILITSQEFHLDNTGVDPNFASHRINCGKKCMLGKCNYCPEVMKFAEKFKEANFTIVKDKFQQKTTVTAKEAEDILKELKEKVNKE